MINSRECFDGMLILTRTTFLGHCLKLFRRDKAATFVDTCLIRISYNGVGNAVSPKSMSTSSSLTNICLLNVRP
jgi:hypothetical protein